MEAGMPDYATLRTKDLGQEALSADNVHRNARAKAVRTSYEFWSTGDDALLEQAFAEIFAEHAVRPLCETATTGLGSSRRLGAWEKGSK
jgi:membrane-bound inhibitor of C-type lysozyme